MSENKTNHNMTPEQQIAFLRERLRIETSEKMKYKRECRGWVAFAIVFTIFEILQQLGKW